jgi:hypothetical protein
MAPRTSMRYALLAIACALVAPVGDLSAQSLWMPLPANIRVVIGSGGHVSAISGRQIEGSVSPFGAGLTIGDSFNLESNVWSALATTNPTGVDAETVEASGVIACAAAPNPFRERTSISYRAISSGTVSLTIYSLVGERVRVLFGEQHAGALATLVWDGRDELGVPVAPGSYLCLIDLPSTDHRRTRSRVLLRCAR